MVKESVHGGQITFLDEKRKYHIIRPLLIEKMTKFGEKEDVRYSELSEIPNELDVDHDVGNSAGNHLNADSYWPICIRGT